MLTGHLPELFIVLVLALIVFGPARLPEVASAIGKGMREFRRATSEIEDAVLHHDEIDDLEEEDPFPHIPPDPDEAFDSPPETTVDTLAEFRSARAVRAPEVAAAEEEEIGNPS